MIWLRIYLPPKPDQTVGHETSYTRLPLSLDVDYCSKVVYLYHFMVFVSPGSPSYVDTFSILHGWGVDLKSHSRGLLYAFYGYFVSDKRPNVGDSIANHCWSLETEPPPVYTHVWREAHRL